MSRPLATFRSVLCLSTALMMAASWPLWVTGGEFPRVPWFGWVRLLPGWASWVRFAVALAAMVAAAWPRRWVRTSTVGQGSPCRPPLGGMEVGPGSAGRALPHEHRAGAGLLVIAAALSAWMVLEDQFRLQPWMYQFLLMGSALAACPPGRAMTLCRVLAVALYFHSGLSKLNHAFVHGSGEWFLIVVLRWFGVEAWEWGPNARIAAILAMPCVEIALAAALAIGPRRAAAAGAAGLHLALIAILGPWGLGHSANVLIWNAAMMGEVVALFGACPAPDPEGRPARPSVASLFIHALIVAACLLPFGEPWGWWDTWPSFALYANANEGMSFGSSAGGLPEHAPPLPTAALRGGRLGGWASIDLGAWSLEARRVPIYPSSRALNGVAEALLRRYGNGRAVQVTHFGRADRRTGARRLVVLTGLDSVRRHGDTYWLNAHPAPD